MIMAKMRITIGTAMSMLKKCTCVTEWNNTRETIKENMPEEKFDAFFSVIESTGLIVKILNKDNYGIKLIEYYIRKNIAGIIEKFNKIRIENESGKIYYYERNNSN